MPERPPHPRLIPVLDVMRGRVVRAVGGRREEYRPVESRLTLSTHPTKVAFELACYTGANELYLADLDALRGGAGLSASVVHLLRHFHSTVWLDAGIGRTPVRDIPALPHLRPVVGFETCRDPEVLTEAL